MDRREMERRRLREAADVQQNHTREIELLQRQLEQARRRRAQHVPTVHARALNPPGRLEPTTRDQSLHMSSELLPVMGARSTQLHRHRLRRQREEDPLGSVQDTLDQLEAETSTLASVIDAPLPVISASRTDSPYRTEQGSIGTHQPRHKRRKLDGDPLDGHNPVRYGFHGQVAPGRLKMQLVSCDGGHLSETEDLLAQRHYSYENVLRNDQSVYCSKWDRCNLILRHTGETSFSMTKLMIKTPDAGFTAPVQEGMVFASMSASELNTCTAQFQIKDPYLPIPHSISNSRREHLLFSGSSRTRSDDPRPPSRRAVHPHLQQQLARLEPLLADNERRALLQRFASRHLEQRGASPSVVREAAPPSAPFVAEDGPYGVPIAQNDPASSTGPTFHVTALCEAPSDDEEEPSSPEILLDRQRRQHGMESSGEEDDDDDDDDDGNGGISAMPAPPRRSRLRDTPRKIEWVEKSVLANAGEEAVQPLAPLAKFFIAHKKHVVTLRFEPAVSAKFILLKLWSPQGCSNIDLQNVSVWGFAGPRWFPAVRPV